MNASVVYLLNVLWSSLQTGIKKYKNKGRRGMSLFIYPFFYAFSQLNEDGINALFPGSSVAQDFVRWHIYAYLSMPWKSAQ